MKDRIYLFFDTETTGIPKNYKAPASDLKNWPRMVQIAWLMADTEGNEIASAEEVVKPQDFKIPPDAARIHGITTEIALAQGRDVREVLSAISSDIEKACTLIAHNMQYDEKILGSELLRAGYPNYVESKKRLCTMQSATPYCGIPGNYGFKWPTLQQLHMKLFREEFQGAHRALEDARACARCFFELKRLKAMS